jgi:hypothetical protein
MASLVCVECASSEIYAWRPFCLILSNTAELTEKDIEHKMYIIFSATFLGNVFRFNKYLARCARGGAEKCM